MYIDLYNGSQKLDLKEYFDFLDFGDSCEYWYNQTKFYEIVDLNWNLTL